MAEELIVVVVVLIERMLSQSRFRDFEHAHIVSSFPPETSDQIVAEGLVTRLWQLRMSQ
jgi:hypothetical protein